MKRDVIFNTRRRRLLRTTIPAGEGAVGLVVLGLLVGVVAWVLGQRDAFDPDRRDLPLELLEAERPVIEIYKRPLKPWIEPGTELALAAPGAALAPFPEALADTAWQPKGRVRGFGPDNLYEKINGEAEKFLKQGFVSMHYLVLRHGEGAELSIELARRAKSAVVVAYHPGTIDTELSAPFSAHVPEHKLFSPERAAGHLVDVVGGLERADSGGFFAWDGARVPF